MLVIVRRAAEQAAREGRQEEFADMLQAASDRFAMLMHRSGPGRRDFGQPDWLTALQDVVRGAYDDDPARMESLVRWAADRAAEEGQMGARQRPHRRGRAPCQGRVAPERIFLGCFLGLLRGDLRSEPENSAVFCMTAYGSYKNRIAASL